MDQDGTYLGMEVGLGPGHIMLDGDWDLAPPPHERGHSPPQFSAHFNYCGQTAVWIKRHVRQNGVQRKTAEVAQLSEDHP